jgi:hypothetical protein
VGSETVGYHILLKNQRLILAMFPEGKMNSINCDGGLDGELWFIFAGFFFEVFV